MHCAADTHYTVHRNCEGTVVALRCAFCSFSVHRSTTPKPRGSRSGLGRYNRMRGKMVRHLHEAHRQQLSSQSGK
jgi:hypothetical protein